ncbi:MAG: Phosphoglycerate kinase [Gammaproteobacteria bacterium]|nr:Phosphoglycerate kinase [Gammaproteobacteria bacterium]
MAMKKMLDLDLAGKRVLVREDLNVPLVNGAVTSDQRIRAALPTLEAALSKGASVMVMSHLGRPTEGEYSEEFSLAPVAALLGKMLQRDVRLEKNYLNREFAVPPGELTLLENVRFNPGEKANDEQLSRQYAALCDVFAMDAFGTAHRAQASTHGVAGFAPLVSAGPLLTAELDALGRALESPARPMVAIVGGSKVSTKLTVLDALSNVVDRLIPGGGIANTFLAAAGCNVGRSLHEEDSIGEAARLMQHARARGGSIPVPADVVVGAEMSGEAKARIKPVFEVSDDDVILDIGPDTAELYADLLRGAGTVVWNGPVGVFEYEQFGRGTESIARAVASSTAFSIAGGGDTIAAIDKYGVSDRISYISTGGGAFLEFLEGKTLPAIAVLEERGG